MKFSLMLLAALFVVACNNTVSTTDGIHYGQEITADSAIDLTTLVAKIKSGEGAVDLDLGDEHIVKAVSTKLEGKVNDVCKSAGCWMTIAADDGTEIRIVTNHEFFVEADIVGKTVVVEGQAYETVLSVAELQHFAEDEGLSAEEVAAITEPKSEFNFVAKGLIIKQ